MSLSLWRLFCKVYAGYGDMDMHVTFPMAEVRGLLGFQAELSAGCPPELLGPRLLDT
jgi:hypothetical protein